MKVVVAKTIGPPSDGSRPACIKRTWSIGEDGKRRYRWLLEADDSDDFIAGIRYCFAQNVKRAQRENRRIDAKG